MSRDMDLRDALRRNAVNIVRRVEAMVLRRNIDIVNVEKDAAVRRLDDLVKELPLRHLRLMKLRIAAHILNGDGNLKEILNLADSLRRRLHGFEGVRNGKKIVGIAAINAAPAEMVRQPRSFGPASQILQTPEMLAVQRLRGAEIHRDSMLNNAVTLQYFIEDLKGTASVHHVIFGDNLEPVDNRLLLENMAIV